MTFADLSTHIAARMAKAAWQFEGQRDAPLSESALAKIEEERGIRLPPDYRSFLMTYGAGDFARGHVYSPDAKSDLSLWRNMNASVGLPSGVLPFSDNGCGDYLCFPIESGRCTDQVVWADHEQGYAISGSHYSCFSDFVAKSCLGLEE